LPHTRLKSTGYRSQCPPEKRILAITCGSGDFARGSQESFNQRITQSTNQPIKKASARHNNEIRAKVFKFRLLPGDGQSNPKTQTTRGGSLTASASGIDRFSVGRPSANPESSRGFITTTKMTDEAAIAKARARG
jgi:hypothetical protein